MLDDYLKDIFKSFLLFFIVIGPIVYQEYFVKEDPNQDVPKTDEDGFIEDKYAKMLKNIKQKQGGLSSPEETQNEGQRITF